MQRSIRLNRFLRQIKPREVCRSRSVAQSLPAPRSLPGSLSRRRLYRLHSDASNGTPTHGQGAICSVRCRQQKNERAGGREGAIVRKLVFRSAHAMPTTAAMAEVLRERLSGNDISPLAALAHAGTRMTCTATSVVAKVTIQGPQDSKAAFWGPERTGGGSLDGRRGEGDERAGSRK